MTAVGEAMVLVDRLVAEIPELVQIFPGLRDEEMDSWPVPVPEDVRLLLRRMSGLELLENGYPWDFGVDPTVDAGTDRWRLGRAGSYWVLRHTGAGDTVYVDVDPATGRWGPVFLIEEETDVVRLAPSLAWYVAQTAHQILLAVEWAREDEDLAPDELEDALPELLADAWGETLSSYGDEDNAGPRRVTPLPAETLRRAEDPVLAEAAAAVPDGTLVADLKGAGHPAMIGFRTAYEGPYPPFFQRSHGGRFVYALPGG